MKMTFQERERRRLWAIRNPLKVREANRKWRAGREARLREQARIRMQRYRAQRSLITTSRNGGTSNHPAA
jgi:hypothetical protein